MDNNKLLTSIIDGKLNLSGRGLVLSELVGVLSSSAMRKVIELNLSYNDYGDEVAQALAASEYLSCLTTLDLTDNSIGVEGALALAASEYLSSLTTLNLNDNSISDEGAQALAASKHLSSLTTLNLRGNYIGVEGAQVLADSEYLSSLTTLNLRDNYIGVEGAQVLADSEYLSSLTTLDLNDNSIGATGAQVLAASEYLSSLTTLDLSENNIGVEGAQALAASEYLSNLTTLVLYINNIGAQGAQALAASEYLSSLTTLDLSHNKIGDKGAQALTASEYLSSLTTLSLAGNYIGVEGAQVLADSEYLSSLTTLSLSSNKIVNKGAQALAASEYLSSLTTLHLRGNYIGGEGAQVLADSEYLSSLTTLNLNDNFIGDKGAQALAASEHLPSLRTLELGKNNIGDKGAQALAASEYLSSLTTLDLSENRIGDKGAQALAASEYLSNLTSLNLHHNSIGDKGARALASTEYLSNLTSLNLHHNSIGDKGARALAMSKPLKGLRALLLISNSINGLPKSLLYDVIGLRRHFQLQETEKEKPLPVTRALIIGQPGAGKSTLFRALNKQALNLGRLPRTHGVERTVLKVKVQPDSQLEMDVKLSLFDFGGQRLQMMVHSLFFAEKAIYLLLINQQTQPEDIKFWLDNIQGTMHDRNDVRILPIRNPSLRKDTTELPSNLLSRLAPLASQQFHVANEITLNMQLPPPYSGVRHDAIASTNNIIRTLSYELASFPFRTGFEVYIRIAEHIEENLESLFPEPFYHIHAFEQLIKCDDKINQLLLDALERAGIDSDQLGRFRKDVSVYLDYMGVFTRLETSQASEHHKGYIIIAPELVQRGLYCVFPPEDDLRDETSALTAFYNRITTTRGSKCLVGFFTRSEFEALALEAFKEAISQLGDPEEFTHDLLEILCHRKLGFIIPLNTGHYLVPAYIEETMPYDSIKQANQVLSSWSRSQYIYVIELANSQGKVCFPTYFLYKLMVHCRKDSQEASIAYLQDGVFIDITSVRTQRCLLRWALHPEVCVELVGYEGKIWCFGFSEDPEYSGQIDGLIKAVYDGLNRFYYHVSGSTEFSISRSVPCPKCLVKLENETDETEQSKQDITNKLHKVYLFRNSELMEMDRIQPGKMVHCENDPNHRFTPFELKKGYLSKLHKSGLSAVTQSDQISKTEARGYIVCIYEFLHDEGLASLQAKGSNDALPNLFPDGIGPTEKTMAKLARWHYGVNTMDDGKTPPSNTKCDQAIENLVIRIPIFRVWAGINTDSNNVVATQYYSHVKAVAEGLQTNPKQYLKDWENVFPDISKRKVDTKLRDKR